MTGVAVPVDGTDPLVMALAWLITFGLHAVAKKYGAKNRVVRRMQHLMPVFAVVAAAGLRAAYGVAAGEPLTASTVLRAVAAGGVAVLGHSQGREILKWAAGDTKIERLTSPPPPPPPASPDAPSPPAAR